MPIRLFLTQEGNLKINSSEQKRFSIEDDGISIFFPFKIVEKREHYIVIDPLDKLGEVLEYIFSEFNKSKFPFELDHELRRYWDNYCYEKTKIKELKSKRYKLSEKKFKQIVFKSKRKPLLHQIKGIIHALAVENAANFSVPGSGKTQIALGFFISLKRKNLIEKALIIGPASCFLPWEEEARDCLKRRIKILRWSGNISYRRKIGGMIKNIDIILVTHKTACNDYLLLEQLMRRYKFLLILDESHYIKNPISARAQMAMRLSNFAWKRMILTGTPAPHSLLDIWTQFSFLWPSRQLLKDYQSFIVKIENSNNPVTKLKNELKPFFIRTTKKELELPNIKSNIIPIKKENIPFEQRKIIELLELKTLVEARKFNMSDADMNVLRRWRAARIIRLLQAASNPALLLSKLEFYNRNEDIDTSDLIKYTTVFSSRKKIPAKVEVVVKITKTIIESGNKVIIWTWFIDNIMLLETLLREYNPLKIYGGIKPYEDDIDELEESRERNIHEFKQRKDRQILLANPAACAESISLHKHCQHAIYLDRNFNCGQFLQSMDRIHRVGMPVGKTAEYHIPFINCAIERAVDNRLRKRQEILYNLLSDPMPVLGIDEDLWIADSNEELDIAYENLIREIRNDIQKKSI
jgi:hypothetical protein